MQLINIETVKADFLSLNLGQVKETLSNTKIDSFTSVLFKKWLSMLEKEEGEIEPFVEFYNELSSEGEGFNLVDLYHHVSGSNPDFEKFISMIGLYIEFTDNLEEGTTLINQDDFTEFVKQEAIEQDMVANSLVSSMDWEKYADLVQNDYKTFELNPLDYDVYAQEPSLIQHYYPVGSYYYRA